MHENHQQGIKYTIVYVSEIIELATKNLLLVEILIINKIELVKIDEVIDLSLQRLVRCEQ